MPDTDHAVETEIKLRLSSKARAALEQLPAFSPPCASPPHTQQEATTYFDTPDRALSSKGVTLRVRCSGRDRKQTVKAASGDGRHPLQRGEWEWPVESDTPDLCRLAEIPIAAAVRTIDAAALRPVFTTEIQRTTRLLHPDERTTVEVVFDEGRIIADGATAPVSEMELELKTGNARALYQLALELLEFAPLALEVASKAERGFRLHTGEPPRASKAANVNIESSASSAETFKHVVGSVLMHMLANIGAAERADAEGVHQIRIAVRRLRAALALFKPHLHPGTVGRFDDELRRLGGIFGQARDWDVFALETLPAAEKDAPEPARLDPLREAAETKRVAAHRGVCAELDTPGFASLVLGIAGWIADGANDPGLGSEAALNAPIAGGAPQLLDRMWRKVAKRGRHMDHASREQLHALRKAIKKLRYSVEFLASLYPHKQVKAYLGLCKDLQELLGTVNDAAMTPAFSEQLRDAGEELAPAICMLTEWATTRGERARRHVSKPWHKLRSADPFWH